VSKKKIVFDMAKTSTTKNLENQTVTELNSKNLKYLDKEVEVKIKRIQDAARLQSTDYTKPDGGLIKMPDLKKISDI
jgi:hypothetical protein